MCTASGLSVPEGANASGAGGVLGVVLWVGSHELCGTGGGAAALLQHPGVDLLQDKPEPQIRSGAEGPEFGASRAFCFWKNTDVVEMHPQNMFTSSKRCKCSVLSPFSQLGLPGP